MHLSPQQLLEQLAALERRYAELEHRVADMAGQSGSDPKLYQQLTKEFSELREMVMTYRTYLRIERDAVEAESLFHAQGDLEMRELPSVLHRPAKARGHGRACGEVQKEIHPQVASQYDRRLRCWTLAVGF